MPTLHAYMETKQISLSYQKTWNISRKSTVEMDFSQHKPFEWVEMDFSMTTQEPVKQAKATEVVIMTVLTIIQITICPMLTTIEVCLQVQVCNHILQMRRMHNRCPEKQPSTITISTTKMIIPAEWRPSASNHTNHHHQARIVWQEVRLRYPEMHFSSWPRCFVCL